MAHRARAALLPVVQPGAALEAQAGGADRAAVRPFQRPERVAAVEEEGLSSGGGGGARRRGELSHRNGRVAALAPVLAWQAAEAARGQAAAAHRTRGARAALSRGAALPDWTRRRAAYRDATVQCTAVCAHRRMRAMR
eukprot:6169583-Prymnesium_polylepis.1